MRTLYKSESYLRGTEYRATGNNVSEYVNLQKRQSGKVAWLQIHRLSRADFDKYAIELDIFNPYNQKPTHILNMIRIDSVGYDD